MSNKFEQLLELLINEENEKAEALFHEIVVEKSRDIYEGLADETSSESTSNEAMMMKKDEKKKDMKETEVSETSEESKEEAVKETESSEESKSEEANEGEDVEVAIEDDKTDEAETKEEESIEEVGGDATDELVKDIAADETGEAEMAADNMEKDMDADKEDEDTEERVADLEDALDELKAEFEKMMAGKGDMEKDEEDKEESLEPVANADAELSTEAMHKDKKDMKKEAMHGKKDMKKEGMKMKKDGMKKEAVKEYKIQKSADNADHSDAKKSPMTGDGGADMNTTRGSNIAKGGADEKGRPAPTAEKMADFENTGGKDKSTSFKKEMKANTADGSEKSVKSPISGK